jgi:catechol 2,3-dioxygenase-like lactoylglutathione lyase family enzyme
MSGIGKLMEIILYVEDMNAQVEFYRDILDLTVGYPKEASDFSEESWVEFETGDCILALHAGGKGRVGEDAPKIVFQVSDVAKVREDLLGKGVSMGDMRKAYEGIYVCDGVDLKGNKFSIETKEI